MAINKELVSVTRLINCDYQEIVQLGAWAFIFYYYSKQFKALAHSSIKSKEALTYSCFLNTDLNSLSTSAFARLDEQKWSCCVSDATLKFRANGQIYYFSYAYYSLVKTLSSR